MLECLQDLDRSLRARGSRLIVRDGLPECELPRLAGSLCARAVHASADVGPFARSRNERVRAALARAGVELVLHPGLFAVDHPASILTTAGRPYTVFTPYYRAWLRAPRREPLPTPERLPDLPAQLRRRVGRIPKASELGMPEVLVRPGAPGGERAGQARAEEFLADGVAGYDERRDLLSGGGASRLSPFLHLGCISARSLESRLGTGAGAEEFRRQLCWRDFYAHVLEAFPTNARSEHQQRYRGRLRWSRARRRFQAWCEGRTGYPLVDASMRQLLAEGWMHNRCRLLVGSFLTKDLGIDWRWGERWFMRLLIDGDEASNNGNWQWIASVGVDPQPVARRIYNPALQQARLDPDGAFVRRYVPELESVPAAYLAEPWTMPQQVQRDASCVIGVHYPAPIVDHSKARREAIARYAAAR